MKITASFRPSPAYPPTVHSNSKSNMAGWINDRDKVSSPNKTPALQAYQVRARLSMSLKLEGKDDKEICLQVIVDVTYQITHTCLM